MKNDRLVKTTVSIRFFVLKKVYMFDHNTPLRLLKKVQVAECFS
jgi:hypothetical protein